MPEDIASRCPSMACQIEGTAGATANSLVASHWVTLLNQDGHESSSFPGSLLSVSVSVSTSNSERIARCFPLETRDIDVVGLGVVSVVSNEVLAPSVVRVEKSNEVVDAGDELPVSGDDDSLMAELKF